MSVASVEHITELPMHKLPIDWSAISEEKLAEFEAALQPTQAQYEALEADRQAVIKTIGKSEQQVEQHDGTRSVDELRS